MLCNAHLFSFGFLKIFGKNRLWLFRCFGAAGERCICMHDGANLQQTDQKSTGYWGQPPPLQVSLLLERKVVISRHISKGLNCMYIIENISWCKNVVFPDVLKDSWSAAHLRPPQVCYLCVSLLWMFLLCSTLLKNIRLWRAMCPPPEKKQSANFHFFSFTLLWLSFFLKVAWLDLSTYGKWLLEQNGLK